MDFGKHIRSAPEEEIFLIQNVCFTIPPEEKPGFPNLKTTCSQCGDQIMDGKEEMIERAPVCKKCANGPNYSNITP